MRTSRLTYFRAAGQSSKGMAGMEEIDFLMSPSEMTDEELEKHVTIEDPSAKE